MDEVLRNKGPGKSGPIATSNKEHGEALRRAFNFARSERAGHREQQLELNGLCLQRNRTLLARRGGGPPGVTREVQTQRLARKEPQAA